jgi:SOS-response transcriptional repressor LexA
MSTDGQQVASIPGPTLTDRQRDVLNFLRLYAFANGFPPTRAEIASNFGWASQNAAYEHLINLERKGAIAVDKNISRGIRLRDDAATVDDAGSLALAALRYYRDECSGAEPSLSVFHRMLDDAIGAEPNGITATQIAGLIARAEAAEAALSALREERHALRKDAERLAAFEDWLSDRAGPLLHIDEVRDAIAAASPGEPQEPS